MRFKISVHKKATGSNLEKINTSKGAFELPTTIQHEGMDYVGYTRYTVWEKYEKCRIYIKPVDGSVAGYVEILNNGIAIPNENGKAWWAATTRGIAAIINGEVE